MKQNCLRYNVLKPSAYRGLPSRRTENTGYTEKAVPHSQFSRVMDEFPSHSSSDKRHTADCLRATEIQGMSDAGIHTRHIMHMRGHCRPEMGSRMTRLMPLCRFLIGLLRIQLPREP